MNIAGRLLISGFGRAFHSLIVAVTMSASGPVMSQAIHNRVACPHIDRKSSNNLAFRYGASINIWDCRSFWALFS